MNELETFRSSLAAARAAGTSFDAAWQRARRQVGRDWAAALDETRDEWQAAYDGAAAPRRVRALRAIGHDDDRETDPDAQGICDHCGGLIPAGRRRQAVFCSVDCQRATHRRAVAA
jgi:RNA polymerase-binding transcription factor DksA